MRFFGRNIVRENATDPKTGHVGDSLEKLIDAALPSAAANQRALAVARAEQAKQQRKEDRAVARMLAVDVRPGETK